MYLSNVTKHVLIFIALMAEFLVKYQQILVNTKFKLLQKWTRFAWNAGTGKAKSQAGEIGEMGVRFAAALTKLQNHWMVVKNRRVSTNETFGVTGSTEQPGIDDISVYLKWTLADQLARKSINKFLIKLKWLVFSSRTTILQQSVALRQQPMDLGLPPGCAPVATNLRRLPSTLGEIHECIREVQYHGSQSVSVDIEDGHHLLHHVLRIFPVVFGEQVRQRRYGEQGIDDEDQAQISSNIILRRSNWIPFNKLPFERSPENVVQLEKLKNQPIDLLLQNEHDFLDNMDLDFVQLRLKMVASEYMQMLKVHEEIGVDHTSSFVSNLTQLKAASTSTSSHADSAAAANATVSKFSSAVGSRATSAASTATLGTAPSGASKSRTGRPTKQHSLLPPTPASKHTIWIQLPSHKLHVLFCLRTLHLRSLKQRILSLLSFFRSIERRMVLDDYGFGFEDPFQFNKDHIVRTVTLGAPSPFAQMQDRKHNTSTHSSSQTRMNCHASHLLPTDYQQDPEAFMNFAGIERRNDAFQWKIAEDGIKEIVVHDQAGSIILYDAALQDLVEVQKQLLATVSHAIAYDRARMQNDNIDRWGELLNIFELEHQFQLAKAELLARLLECYEHSVDPKSLTKLSVKIMELIRLRPHLDLDSGVPHYGANYIKHTQILRSRADYYGSIIRSQMSREKQLASQWRGEDWRVFNEPLADELFTAFTSDLKEGLQEPEAKSIHTFPEGKLPFVRPVIKSNPILDPMYAALQETTVSNSGVPFGDEDLDSASLVDVMPSVDSLIEIDTLLDLNFKRLNEGCAARPKNNFERLCLFEAILGEAKKAWDSWNRLEINPKAQDGVLVGDSTFGTSHDYELIRKLQNIEILNDPRVAVASFHVYTAARQERQEKFYKDLKFEAQFRGSPSQDGGPRDPADKSSADSSWFPDEHLFKTRIVPDENLPLCIACNIVETTLLVPKLVTEIYESAVLSTIYHKQSQLAGFKDSLPTLIFPQSVSQAPRSPREFRLAATETTSLFPLSLENLADATMFLRLDPANFDQFGAKKASYARNRMSMAVRSRHIQARKKLRAAVIGGLMKGTGEESQEERIKHGLASAVGNVMKERKKLKTIVEVLKTHVKQHQDNAEKKAAAWLTTCRRALTSQVAHKYLLAIAVSFHTCLMELPPEMEEIVSKEGSEDNPNASSAESSRPSTTSPRVSNSAILTSDLNTLTSSSSSPTVTQSSISVLGPGKLNDAYFIKLAELKLTFHQNLMTRPEISPEKDSERPPIKLHEKNTSSASSQVSLNDPISSEPTDVAPVSVVEFFDDRADAASTLCEYVSSSLRTLECNIFVMESLSLSKKLMYFHLHVLRDASPFSVSTSVHTYEVDEEDEQETPSMLTKMPYRMSPNSTGIPKTDITNKENADSESESSVYSDIDDDDEEGDDFTVDERSGKFSRNKLLVRDRLGGVDIRDLYLHLNVEYEEQHEKGAEIDTHTSEPDSKQKYHSQNHHHHHRHRNPKTPNLWKVWSGSDFLWRIPTFEVLLPLLGLERRSTLSSSRMKADLHCRQMLYRICCMAHTTALASNLSRYTHSGLDMSVEREQEQIRALGLRYPPGLALTTVPPSGLYSPQLSHEQCRAMANMITQDLPLDLDLKFAVEHPYLPKQSAIEGRSGLGGDHKQKMQQSKDEIKKKGREAAFQVAKTAPGLSQCYLDLLSKLLLAKQKMLWYQAILFVRYHHEISLSSAGSSKQSSSGNQRTESDPILDDELGGLAASRATAVAERRELLYSRFLFHLKTPIRAHRGLVRVINNLMQDPGSLSEQSNKHSPSKSTKIPMASGCAYLDAYNYWECSEASLVKALATMHLQFLPCSKDETQAVSTNLNSFLKMINHSTCQESLEFSEVYRVKEQTKVRLESEMKRIVANSDSSFVPLPWEFDENNTSLLSLQNIRSVGAAVDILHQPPSGLKLVHEFDLFFLATKTAQLKGVVRYLERNISLGRLIDGYSSLRVLTEDPIYSAIIPPSDQAFIAKVLARFFELDDVVYERVLFSFQHEVLYKLQGHQYQTNPDSRNISLRSGALVGGKTLIEYFLSVNFSERGDILRTLQEAVDVALLRISVSELKSLLHRISRPAKDPNQNRNFINDVRPIERAFHHDLAKHVFSVGQLPSLPLNTRLFVVGLSDMQKAFNNMARFVLYWDERDFATKLEKTLTENTMVNEELYRKQYTLMCQERSDIIHSEQKRQELRLHVHDSYHFLLLELINLRERLQRLNSDLEIQRDEISSRIHNRLDETVDIMSKRLNTISSQFDIFHSKLQSVMAASVKAVKEEMMTNLQGEYSQRTLLNLLALSQKQIVEGQLKTEEFEDAKKQTTVLKRQLIRLQAQFDVLVNEGKDNQGEKLRQVAMQLQSHSDTQKKERELGLQQTELMGQITSVKHALNKAQRNYDYLKKSLIESNAEKKKLAQWKTDNAVRFLELRDKAKQYETLNNTALKRLEELVKYEPESGATKIPNELEEAFIESGERDRFKKQAQKLKSMLSAAKQQKVAAMAELDLVERGRSDLSRKSDGFSQRQLETVVSSLGEGTKMRRKIWDQALFQKHVTEYQDLCDGLARENQVLQDMMGKRTFRDRPKTQWGGTVEQEKGSILLHGGEGRKMKITAHADMQWNQSLYNSNSPTSFKGISVDSEGGIKRSLLTSPAGGHTPFPTPPVQSGFQAECRATQSRGWGQTENLASTAPAAVRLGNGGFVDQRPCTSSAPHPPASPGPSREPQTARSFARAGQNQTNRRTFTERLAISQPRPVNSGPGGWRQPPKTARSASSVSPDTSAWDRSAWPGLWATAESQSAPRRVLEGAKATGGGQGMGPSSTRMAGKQMKVPQTRTKDQKLILDPNYKHVTDTYLRPFKSRERSTASRSLTVFGSTAK